MIISRATTMKIIKSIQKKNQGNQNDMLENINLTEMKSIMEEERNQEDIRLIESKSQRPEKDQSRWQNRKTWNSPSHTSTSKIHFCMEQSSLRTNCKLAEGLKYNQGYKKTTHRIGKEMKRTNQVGTSASERRLGGKRWYGWRFALGNKQFKPLTGLPSSGALHREDKPL